MGRPLTPTEMEETRLVFGDCLQVERIQVHEALQWPNWIGRLGAWLAGQKPASRNAVTINNHPCFPDHLQTQPAALAAGRLGDMGWLIHELTHCWQYQHQGMRYLIQAIWVQLRLGQAAYDYGGEQGIINAYAIGQSWMEFNPEQQGDIARDYYLALRRGQDVSAWEPYIRQMQALA